MSAFQLSEKVNKNKVFLVTFLELENRWDPVMIKYKQRTQQFHYRPVKLKTLLKKSPQYGANEQGIPRKDINVPRYIRITDIDKNGLLKEGLGVTANSIEDKYILNNNDILFARSGATVGKAYIHKTDNIKYSCFFAGYLIKFVFDENKINSDFLFAFTQLNIYKEWVSSVQRAAGQPNINAEEYKSLPIPLPDFDTQEKIITKVKAAYHQKEAKEQQAKYLLASIDDYLLGKLGLELPKQDNSLNRRIFAINFSNATGNRIDPNYHLKFQTLKTLTPKFPFIKLKDVLTSPPQYGANEEAIKWRLNSTTRYIRITDIDDFGNLKLDDIKTASSIEDKYLLKENDILFARSGSVGRGFLYKREHGTAIFAGYLIRFKIDSTKLLPEFLFYYAYSSIYKLWVDMIQRPAVQANINSEEFKNMLIPCPSINKQREIVKQIRLLRNKAKKLQQEADNELTKANIEVEQIILGK